MSAEFPRAHGEAVDTSALAAALTSLVGDGMERTSDACARYAIGNVTPSLVAAPADRDGLRACIAAVGQAGAALVPLGRGAHRAIGHAPRRYDVALLCRNLTGVLDYTPADMTITVEAGVTLAQLQEILARERQWLPLDPPLPADTTVGGLVAADLAGTFAGSAGRVRDFVIGIGAIMADGRTLHAGGKVVKNVAGYDLMKLLTGSLGTLAVISEVTFKVRPRPDVLQCVVLEPPDPSAGVALAETLARGDVDPLAMVLVLEKEQVQLVLLLAGVPEDVAAARAGLAASGGGVPIVLEADADTATARTLLDPVRDFARTTPGDVVAELVALPDATGRMAQALASRATRLQVQARAGRTAAAFTDASAPHVVSYLAEIADTHGAHLVVERWPAALAGEVDVWRPLPPALPLMRRLKAELDPGAVLAPGRFVGRI